MKIQREVIGFGPQIRLSSGGLWNPHATVGATSRFGVIFSYHLMRH